MGISLRHLVLVWSSPASWRWSPGSCGDKSRGQFSLSLIALKAPRVLMPGGFTSIPGAIVGGLIIGMGNLQFVGLIGGATENWFAYALALLFLVFRPQGLFGEDHREGLSDSGIEASGAAGRNPGPTAPPAVHSGGSGVGAAPPHGPRGDGLED